MRLHHLHEIFPARGIDVELIVDPGETLNQLRRGIVAIHLGQGRIDVEILARRCGLKNALDRILENTAVGIDGLAFAQNLFARKRRWIHFLRFTEKS